MTTYWNTKFTKRDPECTTIVAIKAERLPRGYDPTAWKETGIDVKEGIELRLLYIMYEDGQVFEQYGYL